jgi:ABC-type multidrug transport system permease subunit
MGIIFDQNSNRDPRLPVGLVVLDRGELGNYLGILLNDSDTIRTVTPDKTDMESLKKMVQTQKLAAAIAVPNSFSENTLTNLKTDPGRITVIVDRSTPSGQAADRAIQLATTRLLGAVEAARLSTGGNNTEMTGNGSYIATEYVSIAVNAWRTPRVIVTSRTSGDSRIAPGGFAQASPGMMVFFSTIGMITPAYVLLAERRSRTLQRLLTTSISRMEIIAGHVLAMFVLCFLQIVLLTIFGQSIAHLNYWHFPISVLLMSSVLALWSACFGLLIGSLARNDNQAVLLVLASTLIFGLMGGTFFPLDLTGKAFAAIGHLMPSAWAVDGFQSIALRGEDLSGVVRPVVVLLIYSLGAGSLSIIKTHPE